MTTQPAFETQVDEIAPDVFRLSTFIPEVGPTGFTFNQFLVRDDQPFLFHTGMRQLFPLVSQAVSRVIPLDSLRWISFAHVEADECGAMNSFLAAAPHAEVVHGPLACMLSLNDMADRPPHAMDEQPLDTGHHKLRFVATPHVPHNWESGLWYDETTGTLFAGDLMTQLGPGGPLADADLLEPALFAEEIFHQTSLSANLPSTLRMLAGLEPTTLATMHGRSYSGDGGAQLRSLADAFAGMLLPA